MKVRGWAFRLVVGVAAMAVGCAPGPGKVEFGRYTSHRYALEVRGNQGSPESGGLMSASWKLENFYGAPVPSEPKDGDAYMSLYRFDADGDGELDSKTRDYSFELRFANMRDDGTIWLRVLPTARDVSGIDLRVLVDLLVESLAGGNYETLVLEAGRSVTQDKRYASLLTQVQRCTLAERPCQLATIELADVDQLKLSPTHRSRKIQLLIARAPFAYELHGSGYPTFLIAGYSNQPARFDAGLADFHDLLTRVVIEGKQGFDVSPAPTVASAPAAAPVPVAPAPAAAAPPTPPADAAFE